MPKYILYLFFILLLLPVTASAAVNVDISNTSTNEQSSNTMNNTTNIRINSNGQVKEYHGSDGTIELESDDGKSSVTVKNNSAANDSSNNTSSVNATTNITVNSNTNDSSPSATAEATDAGIFKDSSGEYESGLWEYLKKEFQKIFELFR